MKSNTKVDPKQLIVAYFFLLGVSLLLFASPLFLIVIHAVLLLLGIVVKRQTTSWLKRLAWLMILGAAGLIAYDVVVLIKG